MHLRYFNITDSPDELNKKRKALVKIHHPDRAKENEKAIKNKIMQDINVEYDYVLKNGAKKHEKEPVFNGRYRRSSPNFDDLRVAQNIFHALTNLSGVDMGLLLQSIHKISDLHRVMQLFKEMYGSSLSKSLRDNLTDSQCLIVIGIFALNKNITKKDIMMLANLNPLFKKFGL